MCSSNLKGWSSNAIANSRAFVYFPASVVSISSLWKFTASLKLHWIFEQGTWPEVVNNSSNKATSLARIRFYLHKPGCQYGVSANQPQPGSLGSLSKKKERVETGGLGQSALSHPPKIPIPIPLPAHCFPAPCFVYLTPGDVTLVPDHYEGKPTDWFNEADGVSL